MRSWFTREVLDNQEIVALNVILPTRGCSWNSCYMCSYSLYAEEKPFIEDFKILLQNEFDKIKLFTSGSFLDTKELPRPIRNELLELVKKRHVKEVTLETRPEFAKEALSVQSYLGDITLEIAIGLESANDRVLQFCINKGFTFKDFEKAVYTLEDIKIKAYLLIKPPFLSEYEAVEDAVTSAETIADMVDVISFNPVAIHKNTLVEYLWRTHQYTPPWIWSVVEVLNRTRNLKPHIMCHPVAFGTYRSIRNNGCRMCTRALRQKIQTFSFTNDIISHTCNCKAQWKKEMEKV